MNNTTDMNIHIVHIIVLPDGTCVPKDQCDQFRGELDAALRWLPPGVICRIEHLVRPQFWLPLRKSLRRRLGRCLAYWVSNGDLPLEFVGSWHVTPKRYRRST